MKKLFILIVYLNASFLWAQQKGDLDSSFADNGKLILTNFGPIQEIVPRADGTILVITAPLDGDSASTVIKLQENGSIDTSFGSNGLLELPFTVIRAFVRSDGNSLLVSSNEVWCHDAQGNLDLNYGLNGIASLPLTTAFEADLHTSGHLAICGDGVKMMVLDPMGAIIPETVISIPTVITPCPDWVPNPGGSSYNIHEPQNIRITPSGEIWFYRRNRQWSTCGLSPSFTSTVYRSKYDLAGTLINTQNLFTNGAFSSNVTTIERVVISEAGNYLHVILHSEFGVPSIQTHTIDGTICTSGEPNPLMVPGYINTANKVYGRIAVDQYGQYLVPLNVGTTFWSYMTQPYCTNADTAWGPSGFHPPETEYPISGSAEAAAIQADGKALVGGSLSINDEEVFALFRYYNLPDPRSRLELTMALGGAYDSGTGLMRDDLRVNGLLPAIQPYDLPEYQSVIGVGPAMLHNAAADLQGDSAIVDWVWLELLDPLDTASVLSTRVGLLHRNGRVTQADGISPIDFSVGTGSYHLRVRHRNHLSVTLADPITLGLDPIAIDLTLPSTATFGTDAQKEMNGVMALWPGDATANGEVKYQGSGNDRDRILISIGGSIPTATITGYHWEDVNLDGVVKYVGDGNDRDLILQTIGGVVPTAVRVEQGP